MGTRKLSKSVMAALYSLNSKGRVDYFNLPRADKKILTGLLTRGLVKLNLDGFKAEYVLSDEGLDYLGVLKEGEVGVGQTRGTS